MAEPLSDLEDLDRSREAQLVRVAALSVQERFDLLDRLCRELTHLAEHAERLR